MLYLARIWLLNWLGRKFLLTLGFNRLTKGIKMNEVLKYAIEREDRLWQAHNLAQRDTGLFNCWNAQYRFAASLLRVCNGKPEYRKGDRNES